MCYNADKLTVRIADGPVRSRPQAAISGAVDRRGARSLGCGSTALTDNVCPLFLGSHSVGGCRAPRDGGEFDSPGVHRACSELCHSTLRIEASASQFKRERRCQNEEKARLHQNHDPNSYGNRSLLRLLSIVRSRLSWCHRPIPSSAAIRLLIAAEIISTRRIVLPTLIGCCDAASPRTVLSRPR